LYWDIYKDWSLGQFSPGKNYQAIGPRKASHPPFLRPVLIFKPKMVYYVGICIDCLLRFSWALQLSSHVQIDFKSPFTFFVLEWLEVFRRWMWTFFRAEKEWISMGMHQISVELGIAPVTSSTESAEWNETNRQS
jgi:hypothetical protein